MHKINDNGKCNLDIQFVFRCCQLLGLSIAMVVAVDVVVVVVDVVLVIEKMESDCCLRCCCCLVWCGLFQIPPSIIDLTFLLASSEQTNVQVPTALLVHRISDQEPINY